MKKNKTKKIRTRKNTKKYLSKGGFAEQYGFPLCNNLSVFPLNDKNIMSFRRVLNSPMDCFINALQVFGLLDETCANIMRISSAGRSTGFQKEEVEKIFILLTGYNYDFNNTNNYNLFEAQLKFVQPNYGVIAGYSGIGTGHIFIIARSSNGELYYIDPQIGKFALYNESKYLIESQGRNYHLLFHSNEKLTIEQLRFIGFII